MGLFGSFRVGHRAHFLFMAATRPPLAAAETMAKADTVSAICQPVVEGLGFDLWGVEYLAQGQHSVLRVYIDHPDGITVDHCADISRQLAAVLDVEDPITTAYTLEVSSPGMDRPLFSAEQYEQFTGAWANLKLRFPFEGKRRYKGVIQGLEDGAVVLLVDEHELLLPLEQIEKANILPVFED